MFCRPYGRMLRRTESPPRKETSFTDGSSLLTVPPRVSLSVMLTVDVLGVPALTSVGSGVPKPS